MTKFYCDICGKEVSKEKDPSRPIQMTIKEPVFRGTVLSVEERPFIMCEPCYSKFTTALMDKFTHYVLEGDQQ